MRKPANSDPAGRRRFLRRAGLASAGLLGGGAALNAVTPLAIPPDRSFERNASYWARSLPAPSPPLAYDLDADVVVVGGGLTGLSSAYYLSKAMPAKGVVLLEAAVCGNGASGRNGGMVLTMTEDRYMQLRDPTLDGRIYELTAQNIASLQSLAKQYGIDCELEQNGALQTLCSSEEAIEAKAFSSRARDAGIPIEYWDQERTAAGIGAQGYYGALFDPRGAQVHPGKLVGLWKAAAIAAGVDIHDNTAVIDIEEGATHQLRTATGHRVRAAVLVLAMNAYTSRLGYLRGAVAPVFDYVAMTPVLSGEQLAAAGWRALIPFNDTRTETFYGGLTRDGRIHFGGGRVDYSFNDGMRARPNAAERYAELHQEFARRFPTLSDVGFESAWSGSVDMSLDGSPSVGSIGRHGNIFYGIGFSGHGLNLTSVCGRIIADLAVGAGEQWAWLPFVNRLPPYIPNEPFRWLGIEADLAYTRWAEG
jgi:glycine/D-amino acid oxidase-like deaminating enzyme